MVPLIIAIWVMHLWSWDLSIPLVYLRANGDETWQLILTKALKDTGWVLNNPYLGAPDIAHWYDNAAAQASPLHSVFLLGILKFTRDSVLAQQIYFVANFSIISLTSYISCRLLKISVVPALCVGVLFSLLGYRFNFIIYAFLANYFAVPLALVAVYWVMNGEFVRLFYNSENTSPQRLLHALRSPKVLLGVLFVFLIAASDGYYAFFTLLLIGFAIGVRLLSGDFRRPRSLLVPVLYAVVLISTAVVIASPLSAFKRDHPEEFSPNGIPDPALSRHSFEAEIYSSSLKLLLAPGPSHHLKTLAAIGKDMVDSSEAAREFKIGAPNVALGMLGSALFCVALILFIVPAFRRLSDGTSDDDGNLFADETLLSSVSLAIFIFLCSISGGIGTLVAMIYPTIRAYDRFPLFLVFVLYVGGAVALSRVLRQSNGVMRKVLLSGLVVTVALSLYDEIPTNAGKGGAEVAQRFLAEKRFVETVESRLAPGAMVYQYPYSRWLLDSPYYGWGSFAQIRLYLNSTDIRWSNGAEKNSPVDAWHFRLSYLPVNQLLTEVQAVGFSAVVVDRRVVGDTEYERVREALIPRTEGAPFVDEASQLAFFKLKSVGYRISYDKSYEEASKLVIFDRGLALSQPMPAIIRRPELSKFLTYVEKSGELTVQRSDHPEIFHSGAEMLHGKGDRIIASGAEMKGSITCRLVDSSSTNQGGEAIDMKITNDTDFDWEFNRGNYPIGIGVHVRRPDGEMLRWDSGFRAVLDNTTEVSMGHEMRREVSPLLAGGTREIRVPLSSLELAQIKSNDRSIIADFRMVQDGNAWFENLGCEVPVER
jgi:hypothetical protein